jgi:hypothetical protein
MAADRVVLAGLRVRASLADGDAGTLALLFVFDPATQRAGLSEDHRQRLPPDSVQQIKELSVTLG